jgi:glycopeptide antibiotics resistance protein
VRIRSWPLWILVVAVASGPWFGVVHEPQWSRVTWIPFGGFSDKPRDMLVNFLLFVPFGWSFVKSHSRSNRIWRTMAAAAIVSIAVEVPQLFFRLRDPSATDVVMAICGACAGSLASQAFHRRDAGGAARGGEAGHRGGEEQQPGCR